jgi:hypothetical protein
LDCCVFAVSCLVLLLGLCVIVLFLFLFVYLYLLKLVSQACVECPLSSGMLTCFEHCTILFTLHSFTLFLQNLKISFVFTRTCLQTLRNNNCRFRS